MIRRDFIKYSSLSTISILTKKYEAEKLPTNSNKKLGVALLGLGYYSTNLLAPALKLTKHCELRGIISGTPGKVDKWQKEHGIKDGNVYSYDTMDQIADNDEIDVIYIVTPTATHKDFAVRAANLGKHVWLEKPMAMNAAECTEIIEACKKNKVELCIGYRMLHEPNTQTLMSYNSSLPFGAMKSIDSQAGYRGGGGSNWRYQKAMGGGALYDMGVYTVNGIRYASGQMPIEVIDARQWQDRSDIMGDIDESTEYRLLLANGIEAHGFTSVGKTTNHLKVNCESGWYELRPMQSYNGVVGSRSDGKLLDVYIENQQAKQMDDDALAILNNKPIIAPGEEGLLDIIIINAIIESAAKGTSVKI